MIELLKTLTEEPAKVRKFIIFCLKIILNSIVTSKLYTGFYGHYKILNWKEINLWQDIFDFFVSGQVLAVVFLFLFSKVLLFDILSELPSLILNYIKRTNKDNLGIFNKGILRDFLLLFKVIRQDSQSKKVTIGHNFNIFYTILADFQKKSTKEEVNNLTHSFLSEIVTIYFIFLIVFYGFTDIDFNLFIDSIFILGFLFFSITYIYTYKLITFFIENDSEIFRAISTLYFEDLISKSLSKFKISFSDYKIMKDFIFLKNLTLNNQNCLLFFYGGELSLSSEGIEHCLKLKTKNELKSIFLITNSNLTDKAKKLVKENNEIFSIIDFKNDKELYKKLESNFYDK